MVLPTKDKEGKQYISYSQVSSWHDSKGFNTGLPGNQEYIRKYFLGERFPSGPFADFGKQVEAFITERSSSEFFTKEELEVLCNIKPLGVFQHEFKLQFEEFYVTGFIDDTTSDFTHIRDYKTASLASAKKYSGPEYEQLDLYALAIQQQEGKVPSKLEVCIIERLGNGFRGGRDVLKVGENVWYVDRQTSAERLNILENKIITTAQEISDYYEVFLNLNKI